MKKFKRICCLALVATTLFSVSAFAADISFSFTLSPSSGAKYSTLATKGNDYSFSTVTVRGTNGYKFKYAIATGTYTGYKTSWKTKQGNGTFDIPYTSKPSRGTGLRLHGATVTNSGTSTISGTWRP